MTSRCPFPGMDPFIEGEWGDFHHRFITYIADALQRDLPPGLRTRVQKRCLVAHDETPPRVRPIYPDVFVRPGGEGREAAAVLDAPVATEPLVVELPGEEMEQASVEIVDAQARQPLVTAIEVLSPTNKQAGAGVAEYLDKQAEYLLAKTNLVEVDLLRGGRDVVVCRREAIPPDRRTPYRVSVRRANRTRQADLYPIGLRDRLPTIRVPLRPGRDPDVALDLQPLFDLAYANGAYDDTDYAAPLPPPPLDADDAVWVDERLRAAGLR